jgi:hypothetical protein
MRTRLLLTAALLAVALGPGPAAGQDAEALRRQVDDLRRQVDALTERLRAVEARPGPAAAPAGPGTVRVSVAPAGTSPSDGPGVAELARPRAPFALYERRGPGQLLFDVGVAADIVATLTQDSVDRAETGTFPGRENRIFPREIELALFGQIDPYARGEVRLEAAEEFEDGARELHLGLAEAHPTLLTLPAGLQARLGLMRARWGCSTSATSTTCPRSTGRTCSWPSSGRSSSSRAAWRPRGWRPCPSIWSFSPVSSTATTTSPSAGAASRTRS